MGKLHRQNSEEDNIMISFAQYAKRRGVSKAAVTKAAKSGRISYVEEKGRKLVDPEQADEEWEKNTGHNHGGSRPKKHKVRTEIYGAGNNGAPNYTQANSIYKTYQAKIVKLDYEERLGHLISRKQVEKDSFDCARITRDNILSVAARIYQELAAESDPNEVYRKLNKELIRSLEETSKEIGESSENAFGDIESLPAELRTGT
jgi:hypothetical protein